MLEKTAQCLDSGARNPAWRLVRCPTQTRRGLHSDFWRHGAGELNLPIWITATTRCPSSRKLLSHDGNTTPPLSRHTTEAPFLDFLYPPLTRESLLRESRHGVSKHMRQTANRARPYTSHTQSQNAQAAASSTRWRCHGSLATARLDQRDDALLTAIRVYTDHATSTLGNIGFKSTLSDTTAARSSATSLSTDDWSKLELLRRSLDFLKRKDGRVTISDAFDAYQALPRTLKSPQMAKELIGIMSEARFVPDAWRISKLLQDVPVSDRDTDVYSNAISAYNRAKAQGHAVRMHDEALRNLKITPDFNATSSLIYSFLGSRHWQLLLHLYKTRQDHHRKHEDEQAFKKWSLSLERELCNGHTKDYPAKLFRFLECLGKYPYLVDEQGVRSCVRRMVHTVYEHDLTFGKLKTTTTLRLLRGLGLSSAYVYEGAIRTVEKMASSAKDQHELAMQFYNEYRQDYRDFRPTKVLLHRLLAAAAKNDDEVAVGAIVRDWESHYGKLNNNAAGLLLSWRAGRGEVGKAESELSGLLERTGDAVNWKRLLPLIHADAVLGKAEAVEERLAEAGTRYGLKATTVGYNSLLLAYLRQDDYKGLMSTFTRIIEAGLAPDAHTFGTVMALTAARGDADLTEQFRRMATSYDIRNHVLDEELVLAHINNDSMDEAAELANRFTTSDPSTGTARMWNQLLLGYASRRNPREAIETSQRMTRLGVQFDQVSYAALMKVFINDKKPQLAQDLMKRMTRKDRLQPLAIHYAMLIQAYVQESRFETALRTYAQMVEQGITPTLSTRVALLQLHVRSAQQKYKVDIKAHPGLRFDIAEELLEEYLNGDEAKYIVGKEPQFVKTAGSLDQSHYFQVLLDVYGRQRAYGAIEMLLDRYSQQQRRAGRRGEDKPLRMLLHIMRLRYAQGDFDDITRYWQLSKEQAVECTSTVHANKSKLPTTKRNLLSRHLDVYVRALLASKRQDEVLSIFQEVVGLGFDLDYLNWNRYIYMLVQNGRVVEGFVLCERNLMASFPGWRKRERRSKFMVASGRRGAGLEYLGQRMSFVEPGTLVVTHTTMLHLRTAIRELQATSLYRPSAQQTLDELQRKAPRTVEAALQTPGSRTARKYR